MISSTYGSRVLAPVLVAACLIGLVAAQPSLAPGLFTAEQVAAGRAAYQASCEGCHRPDLRGSGEAPALAGANFMNAWRDRTAADLFGQIRSSMPPGAGGSQGDSTYLAIVAYILEANGAPTGSQPLVATQATRIGSVAGGQPAAQAAQQSAAAPAGGQGRGGQGLGGQGRGQQAAVARGLTVTGEVRNYVPVTDAMLRNPDPGDWLMVRRTYQASSDSPLTQVTTNNVRDLRLAWVWTMNDGAGRNQPTPLVHNGIMYLANPGHTVQALDARKGDLIWENRLGPASTTALRNMAIYDDKVFLATNDARLVALDARNGKVAWTTRVADSARGYLNSSGPIVVRGKVI